MDEIFRRFSRYMSRVMGSSWAFGIAFIVVVLWAVSGPIFNFSETWQLVINTGTTIVTFLMIFLVQNAQNRDAESMQLKLDDLIHAQARAHNKLMHAEALSQKELERYKGEIEDQIKRRKQKKSKSN